ncbi:MAG TPA: tetratricopeptide repeat protein, partial [Polyangiaceae bacterium]|nr:tetratricopeptide repeat protein [Polyangiaceae bacterium]
TALQEAVDEGLAVEDAGEGLFRMSPELRDELRANTLPSLTRAWHERLSQTFGGPPRPVMSPGPQSAGSSDVGPDLVVPPKAAAIPPSCTSDSAEATTDDSAPVGGQAPDAAPSTPPDPRDLFAQTAPTADVAAPARDEVWGRLADELAVGAEAQSDDRASAANGKPQAALDASSSPLRSSSTNTTSDSPADAYRAATHAEAAGLWPTACQHHLEAARRATLAGSHSAAAEYAGRALALTQHISDPEQRRSAQISGLLLLGRALWQAPSNGGESSLHAALSALLQCRTLLVERDAPELHAEIGCLIAHIEYDIGSPEALGQALTELTRAGQLLLAAHRPLDAARLLNDEAAVWVKLGDPVRAYHLLQHARETWSRVLNSHPAARNELAETEHLVARLLLQAPGRPGRERDALQLGLEHARVAEEAYRESGDAQKVARVWETLGRLLLRLGNLEQAAQHIEKARRLEAELGDGVGLARSAAAAADIQAARRDYSGALDLLGESIALNEEKGLMAGLEFNRISLQQIGPELPPALRPMSRALEQRLALALGQAAGGAT